MQGDKEITGDEDILDSREIEARIEHLESERTDLADKVDEIEGAIEEAQEGKKEIGEPEPDTMDEEADDLESDLATAKAELADWDETYHDELDCLIAFREEYNGGEWNSGATFILDSHFRAYAEQMAEDIGAISSDAKWPLDHIDWDAAADALKSDYSSFTLFGEEYWSRD